MPVICQGEPAAVSIKTIANCWDKARDRRRGIHGIHWGCDQGSKTAPRVSSIGDNDSARLGLQVSGSRLNHTPTTKTLTDTQIVGQIKEEQEEDDTEKVETPASSKTHTSNGL